MPTIRVVTDSACDLPDDLLAELGIGLVPLRIRFGTEELVDRSELSTKEFWARFGASKALPETSAPSPGMFAEAFRAMAEQGADGVVCVNLSSKLSATIEAARQAARSLEGELPVRVVDSLSVTLGEGLVVQVAAEAAAAGDDLDAVVAKAESAVASMKVFGAIDTLDDLKRGGRIGGAQALVGSLLSIKPVIEVRGGKVEEESKQRTRGRSLRYLADKVKAAGPLERLAVMGADANDIDQFLAMLEGIQPQGRPVLQGDIGPVIGTHIGRGAVGVAYIPA
ncbi:DegV family protein [Acidiferrimicrobium sp. IK]|uniref:DegV family protein n=1 Tax=Acidiferrimicrobium sp. IK TaxID=2871700 RepID=UPI0021CB0619|nr:DegV family protein [Acidiferrimicrobium sp. IK]MCU4187134.1 DegV family protein [Acidiferrimicrobium sp. IK]